MNAVDLFSGREGWSRPARARGHSVVTLDFDKRFGADHVRDILDVNDLRDLERDGPFSVIFASPPCEAFSVARIGTNWAADEHGVARYPKTERALEGLAIAQHTFWVIGKYLEDHPNTRAVVENPIGAMRIVVGTPDGWTRASTWYCQWGDTRAKPTDLWLRGFSGTFPMCGPGRPDHVSAPRGSRTPGSTQGHKDAATRALIPERLALAFCEAAERGDGQVLWKP